MSSICCNMAAFAVVFLYCFWRTHHQMLQRKQLRARVAYMLWVMAQHVEEYEPSFPW
jgi:hypothetical protein